MTWLERHIHSIRLASPQFHPCMHLPSPQYQDQGLQPFRLSALVAGVEKGILTCPPKADPDVKLGSGVGGRSLGVGRGLPVTTLLSLCAGVFHVPVHVPFDRNEILSDLPALVGNCIGDFVGIPCLRVLY